MTYKTQKTLAITENCYHNLLRTAIESLPHEPTGYIYGIEKSKGYLLYNAYPILTAIRKKAEVQYGDEKAIERLRKLDRIVVLKKSLKTPVQGGYHSHPGKEFSHMLSHQDINFIRQEMEELNIEKWIEIVLRIESLDYKKSMRIGEFIKKDAHKLQVIIRDHVLHGYKITLAGYEITPKRIKALKLIKNKK